MGSYRFLDHTADIAFEVRGNSLEELFTASALAWKESVIEEFDAGGNAEIKMIHLDEYSSEELLVNFLSELNFLLSARKWVMISIDNIDISKADADGLHLDATIKGFQVDPEKQKLKEEIKAVTFHQMNIEEDSGEFSTIVVFDI